MKKLTATLLGLTLLSACSSGPTEPPGGDAASQQGSLSQAQATAAQADLRNAIVAAKVYFTNDNTYLGFDPEAAADIEPALTFAGDDPAAEGVVSVNLADDEQVVLSTMSASGDAFCIAESVASEEVYGHVDAQGATSTEGCGASSGW